MTDGEPAPGKKMVKQVAVTDSAYGLSDGVYTIMIDTATGKLVRVAFTGTQFAQGNVKCVVNIPLIPASANAFVTMRGTPEGVYLPE